MFCDIQYLSETFPQDVTKLAEQRTYAQQKLKSGFECRDAEPQGTAMNLQNLPKSEPFDEVSNQQQKRLDILQTKILSIRLARKTLTNMLLWKSSKKIIMAVRTRWKQP